MILPSRRHCRMLIACRAHKDCTPIQLLHANPQKCQTTYWYHRSTFGFRWSNITSAFGLYVRRTASRPMLNIHTNAAPISLSTWQSHFFSSTDCRLASEFRRYVCARASNDTRKIFAQQRRRHAHSQPHVIFARLVLGWDNRRQDQSASRAGRVCRRRRRGKNACTQCHTLADEKWTCRWCVFGKAHATQNVECLSEWMQTNLCTLPDDRIPTKKNHLRKEQWTEKNPLQHLHTWNMVVWGSISRSYRDVDRNA